MLDVMLGNLEGVGDRGVFVLVFFLNEKIKDW